jgi:hypothetical protein
MQRLQRRRACQRRYYAYLRASPMLRRTWAAQDCQRLPYDFPLHDDGVILCMGDLVIGPRGVGTIAGIQKTSPPRATRMLSDFRGAAFPPYPLFTVNIAYCCIDLRVRDINVTY